MTNPKSECCNAPLKPHENPACLPVCSQCDEQIERPDWNKVPEEQAILEDWEKKFNDEFAFDENVWASCTTPIEVKRWIQFIIQAAKQEGYKQGCEEQREKMIKEINALCKGTVIDSFSAIINYLKNQIN